jgi:hypothetical protein
MSASSRIAHWSNLYRHIPHLVVASNNEMPIHSKEYSTWFALVSLAYCASRGWDWGSYRLAAIPSEEHRRGIGRRCVGHRRGRAPVWGK